MITSCASWDMFRDRTRNFRPDRASMARNCRAIAHHKVTAWPGVWSGSTGVRGLDPNKVNRTVAPGRDRIYEFPIAQPCC